LEATLGERHRVGDNNFYRVNRTSSVHFTPSIAVRNCRYEKRDWDHYFQQLSYPCSESSIGSATEPTFYVYVRRPSLSRDRPPPSLGYAVRSSMPISKVNINTALFLYHLLGYSPSTMLEPDILAELRRISVSSSGLMTKFG